MAYQRPFVAVPAPVRVMRVLTPVQADDDRVHLADDIQDRFGTSRPLVTRVQ